MLTTVKFDPLGDNKSSIELIDSMGNDLSIVNDARTSYDRTSGELTEKDVKLIEYLIKNKHTSPLRGVVFKFRVKAPLYICRQWWKHVIASQHNDEQIGWNERSLRFTPVVDSNEFYIPTEFRLQSITNKQCTIGQVCSDDNASAIAVYQKQCEDSFLAYTQLLELGVGREQARGVLVPSVYTTWVWTVSLQSLLNFIDLRLGDGSQNEIAAYASAIVPMAQTVVPVAIKSWGFLTH